MDEKRNAPLVVELPASDQDVTPETAPPIPEAGLDVGQRSTSFQATTLMLGRRPGRALRWACGLSSMIPPGVKAFWIGSKPTCSTHAL
jgi:hypothetical protein